MSRLQSLQSYNRGTPLISTESGYPCFLIVDPQTYKEIGQILLSLSFLNPYALSEEEEIEQRDINEIVDVINRAIKEGLTPYYWSRTLNVYLPVTGAIRITSSNPGISSKFTSYFVELQVRGAFREVNLNSICSIQDVRF